MQELEVIVVEQDSNIANKIMTFLNKKKKIQIL